MPLQRKKIIISLFLFALMALFLATGYFFVFKKDKILEALSVQKFSLQNLSSASVSQSQFGIRVVKAVKLNENKNETEDVFAKVQAKDNVWATVKSDQYVKVTFEKPLTKENDITIFAKINDQNQEASGNKIEVYIEDGTKITEFSEIKHARSYKVLLTNLNSPAGGPTDTFYLKATGDIAFDYIVDPAEAGIAFTGGIKINTGIEALALWTCGDILTDSRDSKTYSTVLIGTQCWMAANLNYGTLTAGTNEQGTDCPSVAATEKYCYDDNEANCTAYGGLYQWNQAMCGSTTAGAQGICPAGWHLPTDAEFYTLENGLWDGVTGTCSSSRTDYGCSPAGDKLKKAGLCQGRTPCGTSGFDSFVSGVRSIFGLFDGLGVLSQWWSSVGSGSDGVFRHLESGNNQVRRYSFYKTLGHSVRCLKD